MRATVFIQCGFAYRNDGPASCGRWARPNIVAAIAARAEAAGLRACAGIVGYCDFRLGEPIDAVLEAHVSGRRGRFKGIRQSAGWDAAIIMTTAIAGAAAVCCMDPAFRAGWRRLRQVRAVV